MQTPISELKLLGIAYLLGIADLVPHNPYMLPRLWSEFLGRCLHSETVGAAASGCVGGDNFVTLSD